MPRETSPTILTVLLVSLAVGVIGWLLFETVREGASDGETTATAVLSTPSGEPVGKVTFQQEADGVLVVAEADGLSPGGHAMVIHSVGSCHPDQYSAGDRFGTSGTGNVADQSGLAGGARAGDLPNIYVGTDGRARADFFTDSITILEDERHSLFDSDGSSIIVHQLPDTYVHRHGTLGEPLACGVIESDKSQMM